MRLTKRQKAVLIGTVLGDAFLQPTGEKNARLRLEHSNKQNRYLLWKAGIFPRLFQGKPSYIERIHPKTKQCYRYLRHQSSSSPVLGSWWRVFYPEGRKHLPDNLCELLTDPLSLAVWYMDDGYYYAKDRNSYLYFGKVSKHEAQIAQRTIQNNFSVRGRVYDKKNKGFALFFSVAETKKLHKLLRNHMLPEFDYKMLPEFRQQNKQSL